MRGKTGGDIELDWVELDRRREVEAEGTSVSVFRRRFPGRTKCGEEALPSEDS